MEVPRYTLKYKLRDDWDNAKDFDKLHGLIDLCGYAYNHILALHRRWYRLYGKKNREANRLFEQTHRRKPTKDERRSTYLSLYRIQEHMAKLKRTKRYAWLKEIPSQALQQIAERIQRGYELFFKSLGRVGKHVSPPRFHKPYKYKSFTLKQAGWELIGADGLRVSKWNFRFRKSRELAGTIKTVTIKRDACGDLYVCFSCIAETTQSEERPMTGPLRGCLRDQIAWIDFGLRNVSDDSRQ